MWGNAVERAKALRSRHRVWPTEYNVGLVCWKDGVRIHRTKTGWKHDTAEMVRVNEAAAALAQPGQL